MIREAKLCVLISISVLQGFASSSFAQDTVEARAAKVCAGMGEQQGNFQGTLHLENLTIQGDGNGTVTFKRDGVDLGRMERGTYSQYTDCLTQVITLLSSPPKPQYKTCADPAFGQQGWEKEEALHGTSGWRGGGSNQGAFCTEFKNGVVSSRGLAGTNFKIEQVGSSEEGRWTGFMNRDRQYNYHCDLKLYTGPIYNSKADPRCN